MAEKDHAKPEAAAPAPAKKKLPVKTVGIVAVLMIAEAVGVFVIFGMRGPAAAHADAHETSLEPDGGEETKETMIVEEKFQNLQTGRVWLWDVAIYVQVKNKNAERVDALLKRRNAEIKEGISQIVSRAQHAQLKEPDRQTLNRQIAAFLAEVFGADAEGKSMAERVLIPRCRGFPADF